ncbi:hypothetical protein DL93DRAFT_2172781 [Clavulina sp. PMI_390]|nr:hypothetical protein DL93DRAFT_2172781 [Clavulina sp. PMI_390]
MASRRFHSLFDMDNGPNRVDVVLKSQDGLLFGAHQLMLSEASVLFRTTTLSTLLPNGEALEPSLLPIDADSRVVALALSIIYGKPFLSQSFDDPRKVDDLLTFCEQWSMRGVVNIIRCSLQRPALIRLHPMWLYRTSLHHGWPEVADAVALECLNYDLRLPESARLFTPIPLADFLPLMDLARRRVDEFRKRLSNLDVFFATQVPFPCHYCEQDCDDRTWLTLRTRFFEEFEACPGRDGENKILIYMDEWPEWEAYLSARHCDNGPLFEPMSTRQEIIAALADLPENLIHKS